MRKLIASLIERAEIAWRRHEVSIVVGLFVLAYLAGFIAALGLDWIAP